MSSEHARNLGLLTANYLTAWRLVLGISSIGLAISGDVPMAASCFVAGGLTEVDGRVARATQAESRFGLKFDIIADYPWLVGGLVTLLSGMRSLGRIGELEFIAMTVGVALCLLISVGVTMKAKLTEHE
jgi:phosphatidylserine synthase